MNSHPLVLFDGVCNLCNSFVQWLIRHDKLGKLRFASIQSEAASREVRSHGHNQPLPDSIVLIEGAKLYARSSAVIRIARLLGFPWSLLAVTLLIPLSIRDRIYDKIARNRYNWFGRSASCMIPTAELKARFLD